MAQKPILQGLEITDDQPAIQTLAESDLAAISRDEAFMAEPVVIEIHPTTDENEPIVVPVTVNETCVYIVRGQPTRVRRCFVERLARSKTTKYSQIVPNPMFPDQRELKGRTALSYPFTVIEDKNPKGPVWLRNILAEPA